MLESHSLFGADSPNLMGEHPFLCKGFRTRSWLAGESCSILTPNYFHHFKLVIYLPDCWSPLSAKKIILDEL